MDKPIYYWLPDWMGEVLSTRQCKTPNCKFGQQGQSTFRKEHVIAVGIRTISNKNTLYVECVCPECNNRTIIGFSGQIVANVPDLCYILLDQAKRKRRQEKFAKPAKESRNPITDDEAEDFIRFMREAKTHKDFMEGFKKDTGKKDES